MSAAWFVPRETFGKVGLLDERIFYAPEDVEFCARVWRSGLKIWYYPQVSIVHNLQRKTNKRPLTKLGLSHAYGLVRYFWEYQSFFHRALGVELHAAQRGRPKPRYTSVGFADAVKPLQAENGRTRPSNKLRVLFVTEDDPLYVQQFFQVFFAEYTEGEIEIAGVTVQRAFHEPLRKTVERMWKFYGPRDFVRMGLKFANAKFEGRSIVSLARDHAVPVLNTSSVNDPVYVERVKALDIDVVVSVAAPEIFKEGILGAANWGCINIHSGALPVYRGMMPNFWQMLHGETNACITIHEMVPKLDAGAILATLNFPIRARDTLDRVISGTKQQGARLMNDVLRRIHAGTQQRSPLNMADKKYFSFPKSRDVRAFRQRGHRLI
jgi:methionyl-tRNA formyltransferase